MTLTSKNSEGFFIAQNQAVINYFKLFLIIIVIIIIIIYIFVLYKQTKTNRYVSN